MREGKEKARGERERDGEPDVDRASHRERQGADGAGSNGEISHASTTEKDRVRQVAQWERARRSERQKRGSRSPGAYAGPLTRWTASAIDDDADDDGRVEQDPADTCEVDGLVALPHPIDEPEAGRKKICGPGEERNVVGVTADPDREDLRHRHEHGEDGKTSQSLFQNVDTGRAGNGRAIRRRKDHHCGQAPRVNSAGTGTSRDGAE